MFDSIKLFFDEHLNIAATTESSTEKLQTASAALFLEMMTMDDTVEHREQNLIMTLLRRNFSLSDAQARDLIELAEHQRRQATDYFQFTSLINKNYTEEQKIHLIESLWRIAYVDGSLDGLEEYLVRKIADLLHVPHSALMMTKHRANHGADRKLEQT